MVRAIRKNGYPLIVWIDRSLSSCTYRVRFVGDGDPIEYSDKTHVVLTTDSWDIGLILSQKERRLFTWG